MFTGIIEEIGTIKNIKKGASSATIEVSCKNILDDVKLGDSIATNGVCLTVTNLTGNGYTADVMHETLNRSSLGSLKPGCHVNLERAMATDGRFGGHIVSGHIDGTGIIKDIKEDDNAIWYTIECDYSLMKYIIEKGSITIDGISLTVAKITSKTFSVSIIPHTASQTTLSERKPGDIVNLENDCIGKYVEHLLNFKNTENKESKITESFLMEHGF